MLVTIAGEQDWIEDMLTFCPMSKPSHLAVFLITVLHTRANAHTRLYK